MYRRVGDGCTPFFLVISNFRLFKIPVFDKNVNDVVDKWLTVTEKSVQSP